MLKNLTFGSKLCIFAKFNTKNTIKRALSRDLPAAQRRNFPLKKKELSTQKKGTFPHAKRNLSPRKGRPNILSSNPKTIIFDA